MVSYNITNNEAVFQDANDEDEDDSPEETQELMAKGTLKTSLYKKYFRSGANYITLFILVLMLIIAQAASNAGDIWLRVWYNMFNHFKYIILVLYL